MEDKKVPNEEGGFSNSYIDPSNPNLPKTYANSFVSGHTYADMYLVGILNGKPNFVLNMSFTTAKSLRDLLNNLIGDFERTSGIEIHPVNEISKNILDYDKSHSESKEEKK